MSTEPRLWTLPLRRWLVLALAVVFFVPVLATAVVVFHVLGNPGNGTAAVVERLREGVSRWEDPQWQAEVGEDLAAQGVDVVLLVDGREVYRSTAEPLAETGGDRRARLVQRLVVPGVQPPHTAYVYGRYTGQGWGPPQDGAPYWLMPVVGLTALLAALGGIGWFLGRTVVKPLAAASEAARQVAAGNLDVDLPASRVREVAELKTAFESMSGGLRASLEQQAQMEQQRRFFIGAVAHDLRTPLFALRGYLEGMERGLADTPAKRAQYVASAQEKAAALERLIADLFDYTRLEYLEQAPNREPLDLAALLRRLADGLRPQAEAKGVALAFAAPEEPCMVDGDAHLLGRAAENLLDNALRFTPGGGSVQVECRAEPDRVTFSVADTGPGIPARDLPNLFTPLYRGETSRNRRTGGAGLGLAIARRILRAHGGDLTARNRGTGGAVFTGWLPRPGGG
ncbi:MAG TPA: HAMP domain-containing sensor histidine kinase [Dehalococcoidia bacterium]